MKINDISRSYLLSEFHHVEKENRRNFNIWKVTVDSRPISAFDQIKPPSQRSLRVIKIWSNAEMVREPAIQNFIYFVLTLSNMAALLTISCG